MTNLRSWLSQKSPEEIEHFLGEIPRLWLEGGNLNKLSRLLSNYEFIEAKLNHPEFGIKTLIEDYELINDIDLSHPDYSEQTITSLKLIQGALRLSTDILTQDPTQLAGQLSGRLLEFDTPDIQRLLQQIPQTETTCLRSLRATLSPPNGPLLSTLIGHDDSVNAVAVTPDGTRVISGSSDNTVKVWNLNTGAEIRTLIGHSASVNAVAVTPDGSRVISGASDNTVRVWSLATGKEIQRFNGHSLPVNAVVVTPDSKKVVSASIAKYNSIKVWDLQTGQEELTLKGHRDIVRTVAITSDNRVISGSDDGTIKVWSLETGDVLFNLINRYEAGEGGLQSKPVYAMAVTRDDKWLISGSGHSNQSTNIIIIWNLKTLQKVFILDGHNNPITALAVTPDGKQVISASFDKTIKVWDIKSEEEIFNFIAHDESIYDILITVDGKSIISASKDKTVKVWNLESQEKHLELVDKKTSVNDVTITTDGKQVIFGLQDNIIKVWGLEKKTILSSFYSTQNSQDNLVIRTRKIFEKYIWWNYRYFGEVLSSFIDIYNGIFSCYIRLYFIFIIFIFFISILLSVLFSSNLGVILFFILLLFLLFLKKEYPQILDNFNFLKKYQNRNKNFYNPIKNYSHKILSKYSKYSDIIIEPKIDKKLNFKSNNKIIGSPEILGVAIESTNLLVCINNQIASGYHFLTIWNYRKKKRIGDFISFYQYCSLYLILLISLFKFLFISVVCILLLVLFISVVYMLITILVD